MALSRNNHKALVASSEFTESLCSSCVFSGCTNCPGRKETNSITKKYPHVKEYSISGLRLIVTDCSFHKKRMQTPAKQKTKNFDFVWDLKTRSFKKVQK